MTPERWKAVTAIFHAAIARDAVRRQAFVAEACGNDPALRSEVEAMLAAHAAAPASFGDGIGRPPAPEAPLPPGTAIDVYRIEGLLGGGGQARVYRGRDTRIDKPVAIKLLPAEWVAVPERRTRLEQEARTLAQLSHPHIATIHGLAEGDGRRGLVLELVEGPTLSDRLAQGPLPLDEALRLARQIAGALDYIHQRNIVHRDLKPANIKLTAQGDAKLLDFGLAKLSAAGDAPPPLLAPTLAATADGLVAGTAAYMSPEQTRGQPVDARSDVWAFGCVLFEMLAGRAAFDGETRAELVSAVTARDPDWVSLPEGTPDAVRRLLVNCLTKVQDDRLADIGDARVAVDEALRALDADAEQDRPRSWRSSRARRGARSVARSPRPRWAAVVAAVLLTVAAVGYDPHAGRIRSLAVLPFTSISAEQEAEYVSEGLAESLIGSLSRVPGLRVLARDSAYLLKERGEDMQEVARSLGIEAALTGHLTIDGDSAVVNAELVQTRDGTVLWRREYRRPASALLALNEELSSAITEQLRYNPGGEDQQQASRGTDDPEAFRLYLRGLYHLNRRPLGLDQSLAYFRKALDRDPAYALAWVGLSRCFIQQAGWNLRPGEEVYRRARAAAERAIAIDSTLAEPRVTLGQLKEVEWDWAGAEREYRRALELNPESPIGHQHYAGYLLGAGRPDEATALTVRARELDPISPIRQHAAALNLLWARRYEGALELSQKSLDLAPDFAPPYFVLGKAHALLDHAAEAKAAVDESLARSQRGTIPLGFGAASLAYAGFKNEARTLLDELLERTGDGSVDPALIAMIYVNLGDQEQAFTILEQGLEDRRVVPFHIRHPFFDGIREDPRFTRLFERMGVPP